MANETWTCTACTAPNASIRSTCAACGAPRPEATGRSGSQPPPLPSDGFELKRIDCTKCGAAIDLMPLVKGGQVSCGSCGSVIDLGSPELRILGEHVAGVNQPASSIRIGMTCKFHGTSYRVTGRIRYVERDWHWDEWFLVAADGTIRYLEEDGRHFRLLSPFTPKQPPPLPDLQRKSMVRIDERPCTVVERGKAKLAHFEGQLPWRATPGEEVGYVDLSRGTERVAVEISKREIEFYRGLSLPHPKVAAAFGVPSLFPRGLPSDDDEDDDEGVGLAMQQQLTPAQVALVVVIALIIMMVACADGCDGSHGGGYGGGRSTFGGGK